MSFIMLLGLVYEQIIKFTSSRIHVNITFTSLWSVHYFQFDSTKKNLRMSLRILSLTGHKRILNPEMIWEVPAHCIIDAVYLIIMITINWFECLSICGSHAVAPSPEFREKTGEYPCPRAKLFAQRQPAETGTPCFAHSGRWSRWSGWLSPPVGRGRGSPGCPESRCRAAFGWAAASAADGDERSPWWPGNHLFLGSRGSSSLPAPGPSEAYRPRPKRTPGQEVRHLSVKCRTVHQLMHWGQMCWAECSELTGSNLTN